MQVKYNILILFATLLPLSLGFLSFSSEQKSSTMVSIKGEQFYINDQLTYKGRYWNDHKIEGLLFNSRMVQGIFDDSNPTTKKRFVYPDTQEWDPSRNTGEFVAAMESWRSYGLLAFTLNLQGGSPTGYGNQGWRNSAFEKDGSLNSEYLNRLKMILDKADELHMVVILGYFYFGQDEYLTDENAVINAVDHITKWILDEGYRNIIVEINNECNIHYDHDILKPGRVNELINRVKNISKNELLVSTSYSGKSIPSEEIIKNSDFILLHGNGANPQDIEAMVKKVRNSVAYTPKPIVFNEDDHYDFDKESYNLLSAIENYASWGYFDYRRKDEGYESGFQSIPADWKIRSARKKDFFQTLKAITGY
ncbi:hypothetical protein [Robertkochia solimangrovi]|uniref:hypothetical protein n=1 Tax=Robertkochia solimangrovi TaxID=2213046 RepID=UPI0011814F71|nr:hypothetical protein [Robertkochia solimangrovi]TRZ46344.1 hypothetical protein DMZ48_03565 [Robertkochia solimangrovi]